MLLTINYIKGEKEKKNNFNFHKIYKLIFNNINPRTKQGLINTLKAMISLFNLELF